MQEPQKSNSVFSHDSTSRIATAEWFSSFVNPVLIGRLLQPLRRRKVLILCSVIILFGACRSTSNPPANQQSGAANKTLSAISESDLLDLIDIYSTDIGEQGDAAWKQLQAYPRQELIDRLSLTRDAPTDDEFARTNIAFVFCNLDHDYQVNRDILVAAFNQSPDTADLYEGQLDRLIQRGDKGLLQVLFAIVPESDGGLSEGLGEAFAEQIKNSTEAFLTQLGTQPRTTRVQVSGLIGSSASDQDKVAIVTSLKLIPSSSPLAALAKEMLSDVQQLKFAIE